MTHYHMAIAAAVVIGCLGSLIGIAVIFATFGMLGDAWRWWRR